jgi:hypothetical protein
MDFDLVALLAHAPAWVRVVVSALAALWAFATTVAAVVRRIPRATFDAFERDYPRLGHVARFCRKWGTDWEPALREAVAAVKPAPAPALPPPPAPRERVTTLPLPPQE